MTHRISMIAPRLDSKPWGGRKLERFGLELPIGASIGEALVTAGDAVIGAGYGLGSTLDALVESAPDEHLGADARQTNGGKPIFPLLVKLIDASENLSIQVHPDDCRAKPTGRLGKTEAWYVLASDPGALLYLGIRPGVAFADFKVAASRLDGSSASCMRVVGAEPGRTVLIPAGTIHALGAGVMVYEIQQPSDITYRLDDWGRVDALGHPRAVHLDVGFEASRPEIFPEFIEPVSLRPTVGERHLLTACRYFSLERIALPAGGVAAIGGPGSPSVVTVLHGSLTVGEHQVTVGRSAVVWPDSSPLETVADEPCAALVSSVPNIPATLDMLAAAHASSLSVAALAGATGDLSLEKSM